MRLLKAASQDGTHPMLEDASRIGVCRRLLVLGKMIFLYHRWDMLVPWRVLHLPFCCLVWDVNRSPRTSGHREAENVEYPWTPKPMKNEGFKPPIYGLIITPKNEGYGFPW